MEYTCTCIYIVHSLKITEMPWEAQTQPPLNLFKSGTLSPRQPIKLLRQLLKQLTLQDAGSVSQEVMANQCVYCALMMCVIAVRPLLYNVDR